MTKLGQRTMQGEKGQVLPGILILLVLGTLLIAPALNYAATSLYAGRIAEENMRGAMAADAGVEHVLWSLINSVSLPEEPYQLSVNEMQVTIPPPVPRGTYTLYDGKLVEVGVPPQTNYDRVVVESVIEGVGPVYQCRITVSRGPGVTQTIQLNGVGLRLPPGYTYQPGSAAQFPDYNLSTDEPDDTLDWTGEAYMLAWNGLDASLKDKNPEATQTFNVTDEGEPEEGEPEGYYAWVVTNEPDIGTVGENTGTLYRITATATRPGDGGTTTGKVTADVLYNEGAEEIDIMFWRTSPQ